MTKDIKLLIVIVAVAGLFPLGIAVAQNLSALHVAGRVVLNATPRAIGQSTGREELAISVDSDSANAAFCGYTSATLSKTPGTGSGFRYAAGSGRVVCRYADQPLYCISDGATVSYDESYVRTSTPTATPTVTPTP
jgi:hypothetical protein